MKITNIRRLPWDSEWVYFDLERRVLFWHIKEEMCRCPDGEIYHVEPFFEPCGLFLARKIKKILT